MQWVNGWKNADSLADQWGIRIIKAVILCTITCVSSTAFSKGPLENTNTCGGQHDKAGRRGLYCNIYYED